MLRDIHHDAGELAYGTRGLREGLEHLAKSNNLEMATLHEAATMYVASVLNKAMQGDTNMLTGQAQAVLAALDAYANHEGAKRGIQRKAEELGVGSPVTALLGQDKGASEKAMSLLAKVGQDDQLATYYDKWGKVLTAASTGDEGNKSAATKHFQMLKQKLDQAYTAAAADQKKARTVAGDVMAADPRIGTRA